MAFQIRHLAIKPFVSNFCTRSEGLLLHLDRPRHHLQTTNLQVDACYVFHLCLAIQWLMHQMDEKLASNQLQNTCENSKNKCIMEIEKTKKTNLLFYIKKQTNKTFQLSFFLKYSVFAVKKCFKIDFFPEFQESFTKTLEVELQVLKIPSVISHGTPPRNTLFE